MRLGVGQVQRQGERRDRDQQRGDGQGKQQLRAAEPEPGESVARECGQRGRADAAEHRVQRRVAEPLDVGPVAVDVLEQQREVVEEPERPGEPEAERLEDVRLVLGRVDQNPRDRDQREQREQEREHGQQRDRTPAQPVQLDRDDGILFLEPLPSAPLPPALRHGRLSGRSRWRQHGHAHANSPLRRRKMSDTDEMTTMITARITAIAAARLVSSAAIAVFHM